MQAEIKALIMARFDKFIAEKNASPQINGHTSKVKSEPPESPKDTIKESSSPPPKNKYKRETDDDDDLSDAPTEPSPKKKRKVEKFVDEDAAFAAKLQAEENSRARPTRNGVNKKTVTKKKSRPKKKTAAKVKNEDDSDIGNSGSGTAEKSVNRSGAFHVNLYPLSHPSYFPIPQNPSRMLTLLSY